MIYLTITCALVFIMQGFIVLSQIGKVTELKNEIEEHNKRIQTLEEILSKQDASLKLRIELGKHEYNPDKDPAIKQFTDKLNRL